MAFESKNSACEYDLRAGEAPLQEKTIALPIQSVDPSLFAQLIPPYSVG